MRNLVTCLLALLSVSFCLDAQKPSPHIVFTPQWTVQSQFAGYYAAMELGFYKEAGIDVQIVHPSASNSALNRLKDGECDIITLQLMQAVMAVDGGVELVNILQTSRENSLLIIPNDDNIRCIEDLHGKKVGIWKAGFGELGYIIDREKNIGIEWIPFINNVNLFVSGAIDATLAMSYNEYLQILACGIRPEHVFRFSELGYDIPEEGLYVTRKYFEGHKDECEAFADASRKGWEWVRQHQDEALDIVMKYAGKEHIKASRVIQRQMLEEVLRLQCPDGDADSSFILYPEDVEKASDLLYRNGLVRRKITYSEITGGQR